MDVNKLRTTLFETLQAVKDGKIEVDRAKAVSDIAQTIINTAKVEIDFIRATDADVRSEFIVIGRKTASELPDRPSIGQQLVSANRKAA